VAASLLSACPHVASRLKSDTAFVLKATVIGLGATEFMQGDPNWGAFHQFELQRPFPWKALLPHLLSSGVQDKDTCLWGPLSDPEQMATSLETLGGLQAAPPLLPLSPMPLGTPPDSSGNEAHSKQLPPCSLKPHLGFSQSLGFTNVKTLDLQPGNNCAKCPRTYEDMTQVHEQPELGCSARALVEMSPFPSEGESSDSRGEGPQDL
jgi:hypothetical protein